MLTTWDFATVTDIRSEVAPLRASMPDLAVIGTTRFKSLRRTKLYDLLAACPLIAWFGFCIARMLPMLAQQFTLVRIMFQTDPSVLPVALVLSLVSKVVIVAFLTALVVFFAIRYVPQVRALGLYPRFVALGGTFLSVGIVLLAPQELSKTLYLMSLLLVIGGFGFAIWAVLYLGRSISIVPEARQLVTRGPYSLVRHPIYLGEMVATAGIALQYSGPGALLLLGLYCTFQLLRMKNEERLLVRVFPGYVDYIGRTVRLVPGLY
jgi:protein-S-isoprenylcysteine O-methyltransferase Ste14